MLKKTVSGLMLVLLLTGMSTLAFNFQPVRASGTIYIRVDGSIYPPTAPISTVDNVTYTFISNINDSIVVERNNIVVDGAGYTLRGTGAYGSTGIGLRKRNNVTIENMKIEGFYLGVWFNESSNNSISGSIIANNKFSIELTYSSNANSIYGNNVTNNEYGIGLLFSSHNVLRNNTISDNKCNFMVVGFSLSDCMNDVDTSNTIDGRPVYYWVNKRDMDVPLDAGYVALVNCTGITAQKLNLVNNGQGLLLAYTTNSTITNNNMTNNDDALWLVYSSNNSVYGNVITHQRLDGVLIYNSSYNDIVGNNITNNGGFGVGIGVGIIGSSHNNISQNNIKSTNAYGVWLGYSLNNSIVGNNITNNLYGIHLLESSQNSIVGNNIRNNSHSIGLQFSSNNIIAGNNVTANNRYGILLYESSNNIIYHNNFVNNTRQVYDYAWDHREVSLSVNVWDDDYPSGGNYWSDYNGADEKSGPGQDMPGSDGIGDVQYVIDKNNKDHDPLMTPYLTSPHDIGIKASISKTIIAQGFNTTITIKMTVINYGEQAETFNFTSRIHTAIYEQTLTLTSGNSTTITFTLNTTGLAKGNYTISAYVSPVPGETYTINNNYTNHIVVTILLGDVDGDVDVDIYDIVLACASYGSKKGYPNWNQFADLAPPYGIINIYDIVTIAVNCGKTYL